MGSRFVAFNVVGVLGFAVQLGTLALLVHGGVHYLAATAIAVEAAILHNFLWHERWTWADRPGRGRERLGRLARFHAVNGGVSLAGNLLLMPLLVRVAGLPILLANVAAVLTCALVNFGGADRFVFSHKMRASDFEEEASRCV
jgi:putative flippase GtrA